MPDTREKVPSLETLVNMCCEDYYARLSEDSSLDAQTQQKYFSYDQFEQYIKSSHCSENLKFLIEIFHYEKIWNKIFKRQSSILKCKEDQQHPQRKQSVFTNNSSFKRHMSIAEESEDQDCLDSIHSLDNTDINKLVSELTIPRVITSADDIDTHSFIDPYVSDSLEHQHTRSCSISHFSQPVQNWGSIFKASYCDTGHECICKAERSAVTTPEEQSLPEFSDTMSALEVREQLKADLSAKFEEIMTTYVFKDTPFEINLPDEIYNALENEYNNQRILYHSPAELLPAKNVVLQLLRENIYYKFLSYQEDLISRDESLNSGSIASDELPDLHTAMPRALAINATVADDDNTAARKDATTSPSGEKRWNLSRLLSLRKKKPGR